MQYNHAVDRLTIPSWRLSALLIIVTLAIYAGTLCGDFQYDDGFTILLNPHLESWEMFVGHLDHMVRPLLYVTFLVDRSLYGTSASGYHLLNMLLHFGAGLLVYRILTSAATEETRFVPFWTALLFLIHPIQTETVSYISGRASGLMTFWYLLALLLYIKGTDDTSGHAIRRFYQALAVFAFILSLAAKEPAATFPLALLLWDGLVRRLPGAALRDAILSRHSFFWLVTLMIAGLAWRHPRYADLAQFSLGIRPLGANFLSELHAAAYSLWLFIAPWNQNFDHDLPVLHSLFQWPLPLDLLVLGGLVAGACFLAPRLPLVSFGIAWFFLQLLPTSLIPRSDLLSERNLYLASIGILLAAVVLASHLTRWLTQALERPGVVQIGTGILVCALISTLCLATYHRNALYRDPVLLWSDTVDKSPNKARPHNNLGHAYALRDDWDRAVEEFRIAAQLDRDYVPAQNNLRDAYLHRAGRER
jgi:protein O-mannosyl-transferase